MPKFGDADGQSCDRNPKMHVTVTLEAHYSVAPDGSVWSQAGMAYRFWQRYLEVFDAVTVVARATPVQQPPEGWLPVNGKGVLFHAIPTSTARGSTSNDIRQSGQPCEPQRMALLFCVSPPKSRM